MLYPIRYAIGLVVGLVAAPLIFVRAYLLRGRAFHLQGTSCLATVTAIDDHPLGRRLAGHARVRLSGASAPENSPDATICGMAIELTDGEIQSLPLATFEAFRTAGKATKATNIHDYCARENEFASVTPWRDWDLGVIWLRAISQASPQAKPAKLRTDRLRAHVAAGDARWVIEARSEPGQGGKLIARVAELEITEVLPADDKTFCMSMLHTRRGLQPTGFRNGVRTIVYPVSQTARGLRGD